MLDTNITAWYPYDSKLLNQSKASKIEIQMGMVKMLLIFREKFNMQLSVDISSWGSRALTIWISKGPKQNLKGPSIEIHYQFSNFGGFIGPSGKISQAPLDFQGPGALTSGPLEPWHGQWWMYLQSLKSNQSMAYTEMGGNLDVWQTERTDGLMSTWTDGQITLSVGPELLKYHWSWKSLSKNEIILNKITY